MPSRTALILLVALALRLPGLFTDFWIDEIRAVTNVQGLASPLGIFTEIHHDSNHWLFSLWTWALGPDAPFWLYRLPSLAAGILLVPVVGRLARLHGASSALAMAFTAVSFPLALYSTEARGYALAALASTTALVSLVSWFEQRRVAWLMAFAAVGSLGVLAHLSFAVVLAAAGLYALVLAASGRVTWFAALAPFAAPSATLALLALVDLRYLELGGGPPLQPLPFVSEATAMAIGGALGQGIAPLLGIAAVLMIGCSLLRLFGDARERFAAAPVRAMLPVFYVAVVAIPVLLVLVFKPPFFFSRYFLVSIVFVPVLLASGLQDTAARARKGLTATLVVLNVASLVSFWSAGRGHYQQALLEMARTSSSDPITVGSKHDLRTPVILDFHRDRLGGTVSRLTYVYQGGEFWIGDSAADVCEGCTLWRVYPSSPISGATWAVFRRTGG